MLSFWLFIVSPALVIARIPVYGPCNITNNRLKPSTKEFISDCDVYGYCSANATCLPRQCRKDLFVLESLRNSSFGVPPLCGAGSYCPDDASGCLPLVEQGGKCELNRDDQCRPPGSTKNHLKPVVNRYEMICLLGTCTTATVPLNRPCVTENTTYAAYDPSGSAFNIQVVRDDCTPNQGFCNVTMNTCQALKTFRTECLEDRECASFNCVDLKCSLAAEEALHVPRGVYALVVFGTTGAMAGVLAGLIWLHKRNEESKRIKMEEYYRQQAMFDLYRASSTGSEIPVEKPWTKS